MDTDHNAVVRVCAHLVASSQLRWNPTFSIQIFLDVKQSDFASDFASRICIDRPYKIYHYQLLQYSIVGAFFDKMIMTFRTLL